MFVLKPLVFIRLDISNITFKPFLLILQHFRHGIMVIKSQIVSKIDDILLEANVAVKCNLKAKNMLTKQFLNLI